MDLDLRLVLPLLGVFLLSFILTGPGMWSEKWGWWWVRRRPRDGDRR
jgi:hypothetical protein